MSCVHRAHTVYGQVVDYSRSKVTVRTADGDLGIPPERIVTGTAGSFFVGGARVSYAQLCAIL